jgi:hypothetical protein
MIDNLVGPVGRSRSVAVGSVMAVAELLWDRQWIEGLLADHESFWLAVARLVESNCLPQPIHANIEGLLGVDYQRRFWSLATSQQHDSSYAQLEQRPFQWFT